MSLRHHIDELLKINPVPSPWPRMFVCAISTTIPLIVGLLTHQLGAAIFGSLMGFLLVLNDHLGTLGHRLWTVTLTCMMMLGGLTLGILTQGDRWFLMPLLFGLVYWLGLMGGGKGDELERALLFAIFQVLAGAYIHGLESHMVPVLSYALLGYLCVIVLLGVLVADIIIYSVHSPWVAILVLGLISFWGPWSIVRSYWLGSAVLVVMVLLILDMPNLQRGDLHTPMVRLTATAIGCLLSLVAIILVNPQEIWQRRNR